MIVWTLAALCLGTTPTLTLRSEAETAEPVVRLGDLVEPSQLPGDAALLRQLHSLDVDEVAEAGDSTTVSQLLVRLRLKLAGYSERDVRVRGADACVVRRAAPRPIEERLAERLRDEYAATWELPAEDIEVRLTDLVQLPDNDPLASIRATLGAAPRAGVQRAMLELVSRQGTRRIQPAAHVVLVRRRMPLAARNLQRGQILDSQSVVWEPQLVSDPGEPLQEAGLIGRVAVRDLVAGEAIQANDVRPASEVQMVRSRSRVQCLARKGSLTVSLPGVVALDSGVYGDVIRLQNPESKREFTGTVDGPGLVRIVLPAPATNFPHATLPALGAPRGRDPAPFDLKRYPK